MSVARRAFEAFKREAVGRVVTSDLPTEAVARKLVLIETVLQRTLM